ncbi:MarR family EPS-associated transcriptional regulator [Thermodesulfobacteriota bacterium]
MNAQEISYKLLKILSQDANLTQREIAKRIGISLGKANYCLSALAQKGFIKIQRFNESKTKFRYLYMLTPKGIEEKARLTIRFFKYKLKEYEQIKRQIDELSLEIEKDQLSDVEAITSEEELRSIV